MVLQQGVEANPDKIWVILEITPPKNVKEVQSLNGRVVALNRFVSRVTDKCLPSSNTKEGLQMDQRMPEGFRGTEDITCIPAIA